MEKILLVIDGTGVSMTALDFACFLGRLTNSKITGVFLESQPADQRPVVTAMNGSQCLGWDENSAEYIGKKKSIEKNISFFEDACKNRSVRCNIHRNEGVQAKEIIAASRYADIIVIDAGTSFRAHLEGTPTEFVKDILKESECPVVIAPENFNGLDEIIFTYDGSKSSAFAIKQFAYLFPQLEDKRVILLQINDKGVWKEEDKHPLSAWLQNRYSAIGFQALKGNPDVLFDYLLKRKNSMVVMGAYGRSSLSRFFRRSLADKLIKSMSLPIFISHY